MKVFNAIAVFAVIGFGLCAQKLVAQRAQPTVITQPWVIHESKHEKTNFPMRKMPQIVSEQRQSPPVHRFMKSEPRVSQLRDSAIQAVTVPSAITQGSNFEGLGAGLPGTRFFGDPPDTNLSVGGNQIVEVINDEFAVFD